MSCRRFHPAIAAHAAGGDLDAAAAAHVTGCADCQRLLDRQRGVLAELDAQLRGTLTVTASPDFAARVTSAADVHEAPVRLWLAASWSGVAVAAGIALAVSFGWLPASGARSTAPPLPATAAEAAPPAILHLKVEATRQAVDVKPRNMDVTRVRATPSRRVARPTSHPEPPIIVEPQRALAIARLRELMLEGRLDGKVLPPERTPEAATADLAIAPLAIEEIKVPPLNKESGQ